MNELTKIFISIQKGLGVDPIYFATFVMTLTHLLFDYRRYKNWNTITSGQKFYTIVTLIAVLIAMTLSIFRLLDLIKY